MSKQIQLFEASKMTLEEAVAESILSLNEYAARFDHWIATFSGGKDSTALVVLIAWLIKTGQIDAPKSFTVLYSDTGMEIAPLWLGAKQTMQALRADGFDTIVVRPKLDDRYFVAILGRGLPVPNNGRRYCTRILKGDPMMRAIKALPNQGDIVTLTGVRLGESRSRDERISVSCSRDGGECGQGWFQEKANLMQMPSLAALVHWRVCNVFDFLYFWRDQHGYDASGVLTVYGDEDIRTGCYECPIVTKDKSLHRVSGMPEWTHLGTLHELRQVYEFLNRHENRLRMPMRRTKAGTINKKSGVIGPLTMEARRAGLEMVLSIQCRSGIILIDDEELARIYYHWEHNTWPKGWTGNEPVASDDTGDVIRTPRQGATTVQGILF